MAFTAIETLAFIIIALTIIKVLVIFKNPRIWFKEVVKPMYSSCWMEIIGLVLAAGSLYYLLQVMSIVQIFAVMFFLSAIMLAGIAPYSKDILAFAEKVYKRKGILKRAWLSTTIWVILLLWALYELFFL